MERRDEMADLAALGLDLRIRAASTQGVDFTPDWTPEQRALVARLYHEDVRLLDAGRRREAPTTAPTREPSPES